MVVEISATVDTIIPETTGVIMARMLRKMRNDGCDEKMRIVKYETCSQIAVTWIRIRLSSTSCR